jgi:hypothetical protein
LVYLDATLIVTLTLLKQLFFRILTSIPHEGRPRLDGEDGQLSVSHFTDREDRPMPLVQWAGPVTKPPRHYPGAAKAVQIMLHTVSLEERQSGLAKLTLRYGTGWYRILLDTI